VIQEIVEKYRGKDIAIVGGGYTTYDQATGRPKDYSKVHDHIWTVNGGWGLHPTSELGFLMDDWASPAHDTDISTREVKAEALKETEIPILTPTVYKEFPCMVEYPLREVIDTVGRHYFGETVTYMVAFAIYCQVKSIHFHGTDYHYCKAAERACTEHMVAIAMERGIKIMANPESHFLNIQLDDRNNHVPGFYGYLRETFPFRLRQEGNFWVIDKDVSMKKEIEEFKNKFGG
jgi:hypothetical protein